MFREAELDGPKLAAELRALAKDPDKLKKMEKAAGLLGRPEAAKELADVLVDLMVAKWGTDGRKRPAPAKEPVRRAFRPSSSTPIRPGWTTASASK